MLSFWSVKTLILEAEKEKKEQAQKEAEIKRDYDLRHEAAKLALGYYQHIAGYRVPTEADSNLIPSMVADRLQERRIGEGK